MTVLECTIKNVPGPTESVDPTAQEEVLCYDEFTNLTEVQVEIAMMYLQHMRMLIHKNKKYGNSALKPLGVFNKLDGKDGILIRMDDKLKRIQEHQGPIRKNDLADLVGYAMLYMVSEGWSSFDELVD